MNLLNKLTIKHLTMNKKRTLVTIIGVVLSCALMVGIGLIFASVRDYSIKNVKLYEGDYHIKISGITLDQINNIQAEKNISNVQYETSLGFALLENSKNEYKPYLYINGVNQSFLNKLNLISGRLPVNDNEIVISNHIKTNADVEYNIGDVLELDVGHRYYESHQFFENGALIIGGKENEKEVFIPDTKVKYQVVGIVERHYSESYEAAGYSVFTLNQDFDESNLINAYVTFASEKNIYSKTNKLATLLDLEAINEGGEISYPNISYNSSLLALYGESKYDNFNSAVSKVIIIMLSIISIGCIAVIYNSFAISVMERKKQFGLFSSIGATKRQLQKTVFYEAFIIGIIGIPIGLISGFIGIGIVLSIVNYLLSDIFTIKLTLSFYPLFIIIPVIFMILVILFSSFLPARRASKISPIEAIRLNDDIKIKAQKIKVPKLVGKLFGVEGEVAYKNIKRNRKKYRITIISLFVSIVMFISFSSFLQYGESGTSNFLKLVDYDVSASLVTKDRDIFDQIVNQVNVQENLIDVFAFERIRSFTPNFSIDDYHPHFKKVIDLYQDNGFDYLGSDIEYGMVVFYKVDNDSYLKYKKTLNLKDDQPIFVNQFELDTYFHNKPVTTKGKYLQDVKSLELDVCKRDERDFETEELKFKCFTKLTDFGEMDYIPFGMGVSLLNETPIIILSPTMFDKMVQELTEKNSDDYFYGIEQEFRIKTSNPKEMVETLSTFEDHPELDFIKINNIVEQTRMERNLMLVVKLLLYGFISLVTLIGVTSVFNTINTSIALRRKEFAVLRSIGLSPKGFNKMLSFETIIIGFKSLLYAIPVSLGIILLIHNSTGELVNFSSVMIPWRAILISVLGVFTIVTMTMLYATKKIKQENILDSIREENI